jgi:hypothetical protein
VNNLKKYRPNESLLFHEFLPSTHKIAAPVIKLLARTDLPQHPNQPHFSSKAEAENEEDSRSALPPYPTRGLSGKNLGKLPPPRSMGFLGVSLRPWPLGGWFQTPI